MNVGEITIGTKLNTKNFTREIEFLERKIRELEAGIEEAGKDDKGFKATKNDIADMEKELEKTKNQLVSLYAQQNKVNQQGFEKAKQSMSSIKDSAKNVGNSILKWGLALIGVRSMMSLLRSSISTLSQYDDQLAKNLEYIRYAIATALKPVIEYIVDLVFKLLTYINEISKAWFNVDLFANASAKSMSKAQKSTSKMAKDLLGFDKINKLSSQQGTGAASSVAPGYDLSKGLQGQKPEWLQWLIDNKDEILSVLAGIATYLVADKLGLGFGTKIGLAGAVYFLVEGLQDLDEWYQEVEKDGGKLEGHFKKLGDSMAKIGAAVVLVGATIGSVFVALGGLFLMIEGWIVGFNDDVQESISELRRGLKGLWKWMRENLGTVGNFVASIWESLFEMSLGFLGDIWNAISLFFAGVALILKGDVEKGIKTIVRGWANAVIATFNLLIEAINLVVRPVGDIINGWQTALGGKKKVSTMEIPKLKRLATGGIINYPGRGVPLPSAIGGERGAEGVIPLTNSQAMEQLGETIAKYIKVKFDVTNEIDGRVLSRTLKELNGNDSFARNGG